ncbi:MAG: HNH endonuclease [Actinobacteria bacterium]|nr:HNH endonuclease [Actinomycetota bacterium]MBE3122570.1 HNH endonuclease [Thermoplasmata archaeon]
MSERELMKNDVPELWRQRARAGLCPVCGKTKDLFEKGMRVYCSVKCRDEYASKYTHWSEIKDNVLKRDGERCTKCGITEKEFDEKLKEEKRKYREQLLSKPDIQKRIREERDEQLVKWDEQFKERYDEIMDDHWILEHIFYYSELYEDMEMPNRIGFEVDHKIAIVNDGDIWDESNLQVLCTECHKKKTQEDMKIARGKNNKNSILIGGTKS